jgi:hypothetical protein
MGVPPAGSGCQPTASAAEEESSRSGIPNALLELAEQCERATESDRELDTAIFAALNPDWFPHKTQKHFFVNSEKLRDTEYQSRNTRTVPRYTASLDAAMTLVPEYHTAAIFSDGSGSVVPAESDEDAFFAATVYAATPALALCAAALRARKAVPQ